MNCFGFKYCVILYVSAATNSLLTLNNQCLDVAICFSYVKDNGQGVRNETNVYKEQWDLGKKNDMDIWSIIVDIGEKAMQIFQFCNYWQFGRINHNF